jgi:hypothetical protein
MSEPEASAELRPPGADASAVDPDAASAGIAVDPDPAVAEPTEATPILRTYELPGARSVVTYGLQLASAGTAELRRASLYIGLLTLGLLGPGLLYGLALLVHFRVTEIQSFQGLFSDRFAVASLLGFEALAGGALIGWLVVTIDARVIAIALLAARAGDQAMTLRQATIRARQVFWRMVAGSLFVGVLSLGSQLIVLTLLGNLDGSSQGAALLAAFIATLVVTPFGYVATGIVLGDVGAWESVRRSIRLARARPTIAVVVALFTFAASAIQPFALSAGLDLVGRVGEFLHLGVDAGWFALALLVVAILAFVIALGSLVFTISAIVAAPQVAAFLGLTFYSGGLDRARRADAEGSPMFRWITRSMLAWMAILAIAALGGIASLR